MKLVGGRVRGGGEGGGDGGKNKFEFGYMSQYNTPDVSKF
jgi:hypothetical protein